MFYKMCNKLLKAETTKKFETIVLSKTSDLSPVIVIYLQTLVADLI